MRREYSVDLKTQNELATAYQKISLNRLGKTLAAKGDYQAAIKIYRSALEKIKTAPILQDPGSKAFYEGETEEYIGDSFAALAAKENNPAERERHLQSARAAYQTTIELWRQTECWQTKFAKNAGRFDFVSKKLADCEGKLAAA